MISVGIPSGWAAHLVAELARKVEEAGFDRLWINDNPEGDALAGLAAAATATTHLDLATGVLPLSRHDPAAMLSRVEGLALPLDRVILGIGAGRSNHPIAQVTDALEVMRGAGIPIWVGALGPVMRRLAAEHAVRPWSGLFCPALRLSSQPWQSWTIPRSPRSYRAHPRAHRLRDQSRRQRGRARLRMVMLSRLVSAHLEGVGEIGEAVGAVDEGNHDAPTAGYRELDIVTHLVDAA